MRLIRSCAALFLALPPFAWAGEATSTLCLSVETRAALVLPAETVEFLPDFKIRLRGIPSISLLELPLDEVRHIENKCPRLDGHMWFQSDEISIPLVVESIDSAAAIATTAIGDVLHEFSLEDVSRIHGSVTFEIPPGEARPLTIFDNGERIAGEIAGSPGSFRISRSESNVIDSSDSAVHQIEFRAMAPRTGADRVAEASRWFSFTFTDGSRTRARISSVQQGVPYLETQGGRVSPLDIATLQRLETADAPTTRSDVALVLAYADREEEGPNTRLLVEAASDRRGFSIVEDLSARSVSQLESASVVVLAEMEELVRAPPREDSTRLGQSLRSVLADGGRVILLAPNDYSKQLFSEVSLAELGESERMFWESEELFAPFDAPDPEFEYVLAGVPDEFVSTNATYSYETLPLEFGGFVGLGRTTVSAVPLIKSVVGNAFLSAWPIENGYVFVLGADYYESNEALDRILQNLVRGQ